jgi:hypothetical protein
MLELDSRAQPSLTTRRTTVGSGTSSSVTFAVASGLVIRSCSSTRTKSSASDTRTEKEISVSLGGIPLSSWSAARSSSRISGSSLITSSDLLNSRSILWLLRSVCSQYMLRLLSDTAQVTPQRTLSLQVSIDGQTFATGMFPPNMSPETHVCHASSIIFNHSADHSDQSYTILESSTDSLFVYMTVQEGPFGYGSILKSNSNGTYFGVSIDEVNRDANGYVDFEKMIGIDGVGLINVVANAREAAVTGHKTIQSKITHNDGQ